MPKSKPGGASPRFIWHLKEGYILISKHQIFFKSVEGNFWNFSEKIWTGFPRALPPGMSIKEKDKNSKTSTPSLYYYVGMDFQCLIDELSKKAFLCTLDRIMTSQKHVESFRFPIKKIYFPCECICFVLDMQKRHLCNFYLKLLICWNISDQGNAPKLMKYTIFLCNQSVIRKIE